MGELGVDCWSLLRRRFEKEREKVGLFQEKPIYEMKRKGSISYAQLYSDYNFSTIYIAMWNVIKFI